MIAMEMVIRIRSIVSRTIPTRRNAGNDKTPHIDQEIDVIADCVKAGLSAAAGTEGVATNCNLA